ADSLASFSTSVLSVLFFTFRQRQPSVLTLATWTGIDTAWHRSWTQPAMSHTSITTRSTLRSTSASWNAWGVEGTGRRSWVWSSLWYQQNRDLAFARSIARMTLVIAIAGLRALSVPRTAGRTLRPTPSLSQVSNDTQARQLLTPRGPRCIVFQF